MGVTPSVSLTLDSSLTEGAKDEELLLVNVSEKAINHRYKEAMPPQYLGGTKVVRRLGHEIAAEMAIS